MINLSRRFIDGAGNEILLDDVESLEFISPDVLVIADSENNCLREMAMDTLAITMYAGICSSSSQGHQDGDRITEAKLVHPLDMQKLDCELYLVTEEYLKSINIATGILQTLFDFAFEATGFYIDTMTSQVYTIHPSNQIDILQIENLTLTRLLGTTNSTRNIDAIGLFEETRFDRPNDVSKLAADVLLVPDYYGNR